MNLVSALLGGGGSVGRACARQVSVCAGALAKTSRFFGCTGTGRNSREGFGFNIGASTPSIGLNVIGVSFTTTKMGWWIYHQLVCTPGSQGAGGGGGV